MNIFLFGTAYVIAVLCWLKFDPTKPVVPAAEKATTI